MLTSSSWEVVLLEERMREGRMGGCEIVYLGGMNGWREGGKEGSWEVMFFFLKEGEKEGRKEVEKSCYFEGGREGRKERGWEVMLF